MRRATTLEPSLKRKTGQRRMQLIGKNLIAADSVCCVPVAGVVSGAMCVHCFIENSAPANPVKLR
jgi:hypothetical protein